MSQILSFLKPEQLEKLKLILINRKRAEATDTQELQEKRQKFLEWLSFEQIFEVQKVEAEHRYNTGVFYLYINPLKTFEMYLVQNSEPIKSKIRGYNNFNRFFNTRLKLPCETCLEIDKISDFNKTIALFSEICNNLIKNNYHFAVFYAKGQRSPHIRIYDFNELEDLSPFQREKAQLFFWRKIMPFGTFQYADTSIFSDAHPLQLEFAPHWKYGTPFDLLFEYIPEKEDIAEVEVKHSKKLEDNYKLFFDGGIKFNPDRKKGKIVSAFVLVDNNNKVISENYLLNDNGTTPEAEYRALIMGLEELNKRGLDNVLIFGDSQLIINQVLGIYRCDSDDLKQFYDKVKSLIKNNKIKWIPREENNLADRITKEALKPFRGEQCKA